MTKYPNLPPPDYLAKWDERIVLLQRRILKLEQALHRIKGHAQSDAMAEEFEDAQSDLRAIYKIATETLTEGEKK